MGLRVGLAGNQTSRAEGILKSLNLPVDFIGTSDGWGVEKPTLEFFGRAVEETGFPAERILYVGDRIDNDIRPAQAVGMATALLRRGPWGHILRDPDTESRCLFLLDDLAPLPGLIAQYNQR
jgi:FMN phosphatase YigB (HAD superfamily)